MSDDIDFGDLGDFKREHVPDPRCTGVAETCPVGECETCAIRDCPHGEELHHDGCPVCDGEFGGDYDASRAAARRDAGQCEECGTPLTETVATFNRGTRFAFDADVKLCPKCTRLGDESRPQ